MKEWTRFVAAMLTIAGGALACMQLLCFGDPFRAVVGTVPLLLALLVGAVAAAFMRRGTLSAPELAKQRRLTYAIAAAAGAGLNALALGLVLFAWLVSYLFLAPFPWAAVAFFAGIAVMAKCLAIAVGWKGIGLRPLSASVAVSAASILLLALMVLGEPLLTALVVLGTGFAWRVAAKEDAVPKQDADR